MSVNLRIKVRIEENYNHPYKQSASGRDVNAGTPGFQERVLLHGTPTFYLLV
jgi:hypothetical protein